MRLETIDDPADPRLADYRHLKDRPLAADSGKLVAESELVVCRLLESSLEVQSVLLTEPRFRSIRNSLERARSDLPVYVVSQSVADSVTGFHVHRGCLAIGIRPPADRLPDAVQTAVVLEDLVDVDNVGSVARNAAAFGAGALVLSPRCADPFYRKAIRVSAGSVFFLPVWRCAAWPHDLQALRERGLRLIGAVLEDGAVPLDALVPPERFALLLGSEGPGLSPAARAACDELVTIPMSGGTSGRMSGRTSGSVSAGADSLNVATAGAIILHHLKRGRRAR